MKITQGDIDQAVHMLRRTPRLPQELTAGRGAPRFHTGPDKMPWFPKVVPARLYSCADVWGKRILDVLAGENPTLPDIHPREWIHQSDYREGGFRGSLAAISAGARSG